MCIKLHMEFCNDEVQPLHLINIEYLALAMQDTDGFVVAKTTIQ